MTGIDTDRPDRTEVLERSGYAGRTWRAIRGWLATAPVADPVDRRNAPMLQLVLLMFAVLPPLAWSYRLFAVDVPWRAGETPSLILSLALSALCVFGIALIRRGRFQWAVRQFLVVAGLVVVLSHLGAGFAANRFEQPIHMIWLVIAGLMVGRGALWLMYAAVVLAFGLGGWVDAGSAGPPVTGMVGDVLISAVIFLFIAVVIDRSATALRESLLAANARRDELAGAYRRLEAAVRDRERVQEQLIHAQKLELVGRLSSGLAHDFNHLLGLVTGYAARARRGVGDPAMVREALEGVESASRRASAVANKLLNFSRQDEAQPEVFDACEALEGMRPMLRQLFDPAVTITLERPASPALVRFDRIQFELLVLNIAANARDAMPRGGRFTIEVAPCDDRGVELGFADTGHGMDEQVRANMLEPFFTTKPPDRGTGIGMAVVAGLVDDAGGTIAVDSAPGKGTRLLLRLPLPASDAAALRSRNRSKTIRSRSHDGARMAGQTGEVG